MMYVFVFLFAFNTLCGGLNYIVGNPGVAVANALAAILCLLFAWMEA